ncbi:helix-turn-helix transcriptional regulator [Nocardia wallacei]|uniref:helix-turn-helix transcriptional regulator n=1 Tax=Nocardia wallacei TaxID=480035 RepID=UPI002458D2AD|nr:helix-turn-helix domain-containing protein [Nocardia wallacei]
MNVTEEKYLSRLDVAEMFGVPVKTVETWAYKGTGPRFYKIGRYARYKASDCAAWAESQQRGGSDAA